MDQADNRAECLQSLPISAKGTWIPYGGSVDATVTVETCPTSCGKVHLNDAGEVHMRDSKCTSPSATGQSACL